MKKRGLLFLLVCNDYLVIFFVLIAKSLSSSVMYSFSFNFYAILLQENLISLLENGIERLKSAERYEVMGIVYKIAIPLHEEERDFSVIMLVLIQ